MDSNRTSPNVTTETMPHNGSNGGQNAVPKFNIQPGTVQYIIFMNTIPLITIVVGMIGNCITIFVFTKRENRTTSSAILFLALAVSDACILMVNIFPGWLAATFTEACIFCGKDLRLLSYFRMTFLELSSWIVALVTIERVVCVRYPMKAHTIMQPRFAIAAVCVTLSVILLINSMYFYLNYVEDKLDMQILIWVINVVEFILPASVILTGNIVIWVALYRQRNRLGTSGKNAEDRAVTQRLVIVSAAYFVTMSPSFLYDVLELHDVITYSQMWRDTLASLSNTNAAINFYLYVLQSRSFRLKVKASLCCFAERAGRGRQTEFDNAAQSDKCASQVTSLSTVDVRV